MDETGFQSSRVGTSLYQRIRLLYYQCALHVPLLRSHVPIWIIGGIYYCYDPYTDKTALIRILPNGTHFNVPVIIINTYGIQYREWSYYSFYEYIFTPAPLQVWSLATMKERYP